MTRGRIHIEGHRGDRIGWLRAAVLGANDGLLSTASLVLGVASASAGHNAILVAAAAGLVAGAMSMAAGEYVSVSAQADAEAADLAREAQELADDPAAERDELKRIYLARGLDDATAGLVADQLMARDALAAHAHDELGLSATFAARPVQAALASAAAFTAGAAGPLIVVALTPTAALISAIWGSALAMLLILGAVAARTGGSSVWRAALRMLFWGVLAMGATAGIGRLVGAVI